MTYDSQGNKSGCIEAETDVGSDREELVADGGRDVEEHHSNDDRLQLRDPVNGGEE